MSLSMLTAGRSGHFDRLMPFVRRLSLRRLALGVVAALLIAGPAIADDAKACHDEAGDKALAACDRAISSGKYSGTDLAKLHTSRGVERRRKKDLDGAIADYSEAIRINPKDHFAYNNRANIRRDKGDRAGAIADYSEALKIDPGYTAAYVNRGLLHERMGRKDLARADFEEAVKRPAKYGNGPGAQSTAKARLFSMGPKT